jgi:hypothetical protein
MTVEIVTVDRLKQARFRTTFHARLDRGGHMWGWTCIDFPRLAFSRTRKKRGDPLLQTITVDGVEVADLAAAAHALNGPPPAPAEPDPQLELRLR